MKSVARTAIALGLVCSAHAARADQAPLPPRFELGARLGFGLPLGSASSAGDFNMLISNMVPIAVDAGIAINDNWYFGGYFQYGIGSIPAMLASDCGTPGVSCTIFDGRIGANIELRTHTRRDQVWVGVGTGYEWYGLDASAGGATATVRYSGWEFVNFQAGYDYLAKPTVGVGPFVALTVAQFTDVSASIPSSAAGGTAMNISQSIPSQALHEWLTFGVRGFFDMMFTTPKPQSAEPVDTGPPEVTDPDAEDPKPPETEPVSPASSD